MDADEMQLLGELNRSLTGARREAADMRAQRDFSQDLLMAWLDHTEKHAEFNEWFKTKHPDLAATIEAGKASRS